MREHPASSASYRCSPSRSAVVARDKLLGVLAFARSETRVSAEDLADARLLGIAATVAFMA